MEKINTHPNCPVTKCACELDCYSSCVRLKEKQPLQIITMIPPECEQYAHDIRRFMDAMLYKLKKHSGKGRWHDMAVEKAMELLRGEVLELDEAIRDGNRIEIELEAADVANYAMIVAAIIIERGK